MSESSGDDGHYCRLMLDINGGQTMRINEKFDTKELASAESQMIWQAITALQ